MDKHSTNSSQNELIYRSAKNLAEMISSGQVSSEAVIEAHLARIAVVNPQLNAVVNLATDAAMEQARAADAALARGENVGPLHGVPMTIKDSFDTAGLVSSWGAVGRKNFIPAQDATVVSRLKTAGAILIGKSNTPEFTLGYETDNRVYGRTNNPYNLDHTPGGSSGGAAAIVAAGGVPFDIGTDTGGSIRWPCHCCGLVGIKPTSGRVSRAGHAIPPGGLLDQFTQAGPIARRVEDLTLILPIISGPDGRDPMLAPVPVQNPDNVDLKNLRGTFHTDNGVQSPTPEIKAAVERAVNFLHQVGVDFDERTPPGIEESIELLPSLFRGWDGGAWVRMLLARASTAESDTTLKRYLDAKSASPDFLVGLIDRWDRFRRRMLTFIEPYDLLISPVNAYPAFQHGEMADKYPGFSYTMTYNLTGWPAVVVRAGTSATGLPLGVQIVAKPWREDLALAVAATLEAGLGGWPLPDYSEFTDDIVSKTKLI